MLLERRTLLVGGAAAAALSACGGDPGQQPPDDSGTTTDDTTSTGDDASTGGDDASTTCTPGPTMIGPVDAYPPMSWTQVRHANVIIGHDGGGLYAFSDICTHERCEVNAPAADGSIYCACHGSRFDSNGAVVNGPAFRPLQHYALFVCDGVVSVDTSMRVDASTRTSV